MFRIPVPTLIKPGCFNDLAKITQTQVPNMTRALLVTDKAIRTKTSFITNAESQFGSSNLELFMYDNVPVNPRIETSDEIAALAKLSILKNIGIYYINIMCFKYINPILYYINIEKIRLIVLLVSVVEV